MSIVLQGSTSGSVTLQEPAVAGTTVLTLPAVSGTVLTDTSPKAGNVLQVVSATSTTSTTITGGPTDTTLTATITPTSATSKILVLVSQQVYLVGTGGDGGFMFYLLKNGSSLYSVSFHSLYISCTSAIVPELITNFPVMYLDSPATTSALTYKMQATATSGGVAVFQWSSNLSTITLMEIAA